MQGRMVDPLDDRIQAFPVGRWREEFPLAAALQFSSIEWTIDDDGFNENPLMSPTGRDEISDLSRRFGLSIAGVTGDCFMQSPFWKACRPEERAQRLQMLRDVVSACAELSIPHVVVPAVDDASLSSAVEESAFRSGLMEVAGDLAQCGVRVAVESDYPPTRLAQLIDHLPHDVVGVNYDIGNSAGCGFDPRDEFDAYGDRIINVHIKDRPRGGSTVPLGEGAANFRRVFELLHACGYEGSLVLQAARATDGDHVGAIARYRAYIEEELQAVGS